MCVQRCAPRVRRGGARDQGEKGRKFEIQWTWRTGVEAAESRRRYTKRAGMAGMAGAADRLEIVRRKGWLATRQVGWQAEGKAMHFMIEYSERSRGRADFYV